MDSKHSLYILNNKPARFIFSLAVSSLLFAGITFLSSLAIVNTDISENTGSLFMIIAAAAASLMFSLLLTVLLGTKGIFSALIAFLTVVLIKILMTVIIAGTLRITGQGTVGIVFTAVFCLLGAIIGVYIKK